MTDQNEHLAYKYVKVGLKSIYTGMEALSKVVKSLEPKMRQGLSSVAGNFVKCCDLLEILNSLLKTLHAVINRYLH